MRFSLLLREKENYISSGKGKRKEGKKKYKMTRKAVKKEETRITPP